MIPGIVQSQMMTGGASGGGGTLTDISLASPAGNLSVIAQAGYAVGAWLSDDNDTLIVANRESPIALYEYSLSTTGAVSSGSYTSTSSTISPADNQSWAGHMSDSGDLFFIVDQADSSGTCYRFGLSSSFDISTISYSGGSFSKAGLNGASAVRGVFVSPAGDKMFVANPGLQILEQYTLSSANDPSTATLDTTLDYSALIGTSFSAAHHIAFNKSGTILLSLDATQRIILQHDLSSAYDLDSAAQGTELDISGQDSEPTSISVDPTESYLLMTGVSGDRVYQYDLA